MSIPSPLASSGSPFGGAPTSTVGGPTASKLGGAPTSVFGGAPASTPGGAPTSTFGAAPASSLIAATGPRFGASTINSITAPSASASSFTSASAAPKTSPFATTASSLAPVPTESPIAPSSALAPPTPSWTFDTTVYGTPKIQEVTLPVKIRYSFVERTTFLSTAAQASTAGSFNWFIKVNYLPQQQQAGTVSTAKGCQIEVELSWRNGQAFSKKRKPSSETDLDVRQYKSMSFIPKKDPCQLVTFPIAEDALLDGKAIKGSVPS